MNEVNAESTACRTCRGSGWLVAPGESGEEVERCPDCQGESRRARLLQLAQIPPRYFNKGFDLYATQTDTQLAGLRRAVDYVESFPDVDRGLLFVGPCGVGKTHLSVAIMKQLVQERMITARFVDEVELLWQLKYSYGQDSPATEEEVLSPLTSVELLVWDDLGTGRPTAWVMDIIRMIINYRYTHKKQTIITSNWPLRRSSVHTAVTETEQTLEERIGRRLYSRIMEMCEVVAIKGPDARAVIHKAGMDFWKQSKPEEEHQAASLIKCPRCGKSDVSVLDESSMKCFRDGSYVELSCLCRSCSAHFLTRFFPESSTVDYPSE
jgi:DNA replication protein DnaC